MGWGGGGEGAGNSVRRTELGQGIRITWRPEAPEGASQAESGKDIEAGPGNRRVPEKPGKRQRRLPEPPPGGPRQNFVLYLRGSGKPPRA